MGFDAKNLGSGKTSSVLTVTAFLAKIKNISLALTSELPHALRYFSFLNRPFQGVS